MSTVNINIIKYQNFKHWFANSKVVDSNGNPLIVYKGYYPFDSDGKEITKIHNQSEFPAFNQGEKGVRLAGFFSDDPNVCKRFMWSKHSRLSAFYLKIEHPFIIDAKHDYAGKIQFGESGRAFREAIRSGKYDGVIILNTKDESNVYVPLKPNQIKSVENVTFDPDADEFMKESKVKYKQFFHDSILVEQKVDKKEYDRRYNFIQSYVDKFVENCPGKTREEKLTYAWDHHKSTMEKLMAGLNSLQKPVVFGRIGKEHPDSYKSKFIADKYYIRFGDFPKSGRSKNYATGEKEIGVSAYPVKWNTQLDKWEITEEQLEEFSALLSLTYDIIRDKGRPVYLIHGQELNDLGSDGEPMLDINNVKIVKKLQPYEFFSKEIGEDWWRDEN